ncbi:co-chaperonin GroES [Candidatus Omnitrophus magneticus]|uniref:Co-chaperonin GroES n=1 Tax=Candidatus Omnitrophus magneticus TaxID=1609969 RepID=A0A0F0CRH8_9BACT|nr:co-chaperonin GroES [Candidatus Omnitrophus magneticus]
MKIKPLGNRVLVEVLESEEKTKGGIVLPDTAKEKQQKGKVVAVGPGSIDDNGKRIPMDVKAGDVIIFGKYSGTEIKLDEQDLLVLKEEDILGIVA